MREARVAGLRKSLRLQAPAVAVVALFVLSAFIVERVLERPDFLRLGFVSPTLMLGVATYVPLLVIFHATRSVVVEGRSVLDPLTWKTFRTRYFSLEALIPTLLLLGLIAPLSSTFVAYKALIPEINPFAWDTAFMDLDAWVHGGRHPWTILLPAFGSPGMIDFLDAVYITWFPALVLTMVWQAWSGRDPLRAQFFLTYVLSWILLGLLMAVVFSSAGPCYYRAVVGAPSTYDALMAHLGGVDGMKPLLALEIQDHLWGAYVGENDSRYQGISAMPSMHLAMAMLMVLVYFRASRVAGIAATVFACLILLGSVMLGWHYAVDGYVGAAMVVPVWWASGRVVGALERTDEP